MNSVESTPVNSINQKKIELEQEINRLKTKKSFIETEINCQLQTLEGMQTRHDTLSNSITSFESTLEKLHKEIISLTELYNKVYSTIENSLGGFSKYLIDLDKHYSLQEEKVKNLQSEYERVHKQIVEENEHLLINKRDLDIYRMRLEKKCAELYPEIKIIL